MVRLSKEQLDARKKRIDRELDRAQNEILTAEKALKQTEHELAKLDRAIRFHKLIIIGELFKKADLLESYDPDKLLKLLIRERNNLIK